MIILQGFYWNCLQNWWQELYVLAEEISKKGFDEIWLPPVSAGMAGTESMGYDIKEHYNLNSRFGTEEKLKNLIFKFHENEIKVMADLVLGHMLGGELEENILLNKDTYTKFNEDRFPKNYENFCHECGGCECRNSFGETICYYSNNGYMAEGLKSWAKWLKEEIGFDSFRLDNIKDIRWDFTKEFTEEFKENTFMMGEYWEGDDSKLKEVSSYNRQLYLLNFPLFYEIKEMCMNPDYKISNLEKIEKKNRVNFLSNHDIERRERKENKDAIADKKELGYAYILFQDNPAVVYWDDYFKYELKEKIDELIDLRKKTEGLELELIKAGDDIYHAKRGCYHLIINNSNNEIRLLNNIKVQPRSYIIKNKGVYNK